MRNGHSIVCILPILYFFGLCCYSSLYPDPPLGFGSLGPDARFQTSGGGRVKVEEVEKFRQELLRKRIETEIWAREMMKKYENKWDRVKFDLLMFSIVALPTGIGALILWFISPSDVLGFLLWMSWFIIWFVGFSDSVYESG